MLRFQVDVEGLMNGGGVPTTGRPHACFQVEPDHSNQSWDSPLFLWYIIPITCGDVDMMCSRSVHYNVSHHSRRRLR
jgi:hypothetical protein